MNLIRRAPTIYLGMLWFSYWSRNETIVRTILSAISHLKCGPHIFECNRTLKSLKLATLWRQRMPRSAAAHTFLRSRLNFCGTHNFKCDPHFCLTKFPKHAILRTAQFLVRPHISKSNRAQCFKVSIFMHKLDMVEEIKHDKPNTHSPNSN